MVKYTPEYLDEMVDAISALAADHVNDAVHDGLGAILRIRSTLLRRDNRQGLVEIARRAASAKGVARLEDLVWEDGRIAITISARLVYGDDKAPLSLLRRDDRYYLHPDFTQGVLEDGELVDVTDELDGYKAEVSIRDRETAVEWSCPASFEAEVEELEELENGDARCQVVLRGKGYLDPRAVKGRAALAKGMWDVWVPVRGLGLVRKARLGADRAAHVDERCLPAVLGKPAQLTVPYFTDPHGNLSLDVDRRGKKLGNILADREVLRVPDVSALEIELAAVSVPGTAPAPAWLVLRGKGDQAGSLALPATLQPVGGRVHLLALDHAYGKSPFTGLRAGDLAAGRPARRPRRPRAEDRHGPRGRAGPPAARRRARLRRPGHRQGGRVDAAAVRQARHPAPDRRPGDAPGEAGDAQEAAERGGQVRRVD